MLDYCITGLPRSGTAWLANFLSTGDSLCVHEITNYNMVRTHHKYFGTADSSFWKAPVPYKKLIYIDREEEAVIQSIINKGFPYARRLVKMCSEAGMKEKAHLIIKYDDLFTFDTAKFIYNYCLPGLKLDEDRLNILLTLNVQQI